jgi:hypothetical protein
MKINKVFYDYKKRCCYVNYSLGNSYFLESFLISVDTKKILINQAVAELESTSLPAQRLGAPCQTKRSWLGLKTEHKLSIYL